MIDITNTISSTFSCQNGYVSSTYIVLNEVTVRALGVAIVSEGMNSVVLILSLGSGIVKNVEVQNQKSLLSSVCST